MNQKITQSIPEPFINKMKLDKEIEEMEKQSIIPFLPWRKIHNLQETARLRCIQALKRSPTNGVA